MNTIPLITSHIHLLTPPPLNSPGIFKLDYSLRHTKLFLDQVHANTIGGFLPNTNSPDPDFGKCLQCAAIDRARYRASPPIDRSAFCTRCFQQYCFDSKNLTSVKALPGRKLVFVDPDPQGFSAVKTFLSKNKVGFILGFVGLAIVVTAISAFLCVCFLFTPLPSVLLVLGWILTRRTLAFFFLL